MNWKTVAENDLRLYNLRQQSLENIKEKISALKQTQDGLKSVNIGKSPTGVKAGYDQKIIDSIVEIERLKLNYTVSVRLIKLTEKGLAALSDEEREVLTCFYINDSGRCVDTLRDRLGYEKSQIYRIKDRALYKFTVSCYGITEL